MRIHRIVYVNGRNFIYGNSSATKPLSHKGYDKKEFLLIYYGELVYTRLKTSSKSD